MLLSSNDREDVKKEGEERGEWSGVAVVH